MLTKAEKLSLDTFLTEYDDKKTFKEILDSIDKYENNDADGNMIYLEWEVFEGDGSLAEHIQVQHDLIVTFFGDAANLTADEPYRDQDDLDIEKRSARHILETILDTVDDPDITSDDVCDIVRMNTQELIDRYDSRVENPMIATLKSLL